MNRLFIVAGASGAGKSFLLEQVKVLGRGLQPVKKLSTRSPRPYESEGVQGGLDLEFSRPSSDIRRCKYNYQYAGHFYGIRKRDLDHPLSRGASPVVIVRDIATIKELKSDYPSAIVLYLFTRHSGEDLRLVLREQGRTDIDIETRMKQMDQDFHEYIWNVNVFDRVLVNDYDPQNLLNQFRGVLAGASGEVRVDPNFVFVLMSFSREMTKTYRAIRSAGAMTVARKLRVERIDAKKGDYKITDEILKNIERASLIVCDLTFDRPNVYYELGYARGLGKTVLSCAKEGAELHFDIKDFRTIFYPSVENLKAQLHDEFEDFFGQDGDGSKMREGGDPIGSH